METVTRIFVCGTPSNKGGFMYKTLYGPEFTSHPADYLDIYDPSKMNNGCTEIAKSIEIDGRWYVFIGVYQGIKPNDQNTNRGSFIGAGALIEGEVTPEEVIGYLSLIGMIISHLEGLRDKNNAFEPEFILENYLPPKSITVSDLWDKSVKISKQSLRKSSGSAGDLYCFNNTRDSWLGSMPTDKSKLEKVIAQRDQTIDQLRIELHKLRQNKPAFKARNQNIGQSGSSPRMSLGGATNTPVPQYQNQTMLHPGRSQFAPAQQGSTYQRNTSGTHRKNVRKHRKKSYTNDVLLAVSGVSIVLVIAMFIYSLFDSGELSSTDIIADPSSSNPNIQEPNKQQESPPSSVAKQRKDALDKTSNERER